MTTRAFGSLAVLALVSLFLAPPTTAEASWPHERDGVVLGFNVGAGSGGVNLSGIDSDRESGFGGNFRVGYAFTPQIAAGIEGNGWTKEVDNETWTFNVTTLALTYYPGAGGFFVRGGVGVGSVEYGLESGGVSYSASDDGFGFLLAAGYEWRLTRRFALGPEFDYGYGNVNDDLSMNYWNVTAGLNWYF
jgi:hypothetical protein